MTEGRAPEQDRCRPGRATQAVGRGGDRSGNRLVIVESLARAKEIDSFLGAGDTVESSIGHLRDLPRNAADVPASHEGRPGPE